METSGRITALPVSEIEIPVPWGHIVGKGWGFPQGGSPVLCLHGVQDNASTFDTLLPLLPPSFYYVALDLPSHGQSSHFPAGQFINLMDFALSVERVVQHLGWDHFQIIGHSLGGKIALLYASLFPMKVTKLVVLDPIFTRQATMSDLARVIVKRHSQLLGLEKKLASHAPPAYSLDVALRRLTESRPSLLTKEAAQYLFSRGVKVNGDGYYFSADQRLKMTVQLLFTKEQCLELFKQIQCPLLVIHASETFNSGTHQFQDCDEMFRSKLGENYMYKVIDGSHDVHLLSPERLVNHVGKFLLMHKSSL